MLLGQLDAISTPLSVGSKWKRFTLRDYLLWTYETLLSLSLKLSAYSDLVTFGQLNLLLPTSKLETKA